MRANGEWEERGGAPAETRFDLRRGVTSVGLVVSESGRTASSAPKGRYSAATVRGTKWTIADRYDGALTHDITHSVAVTEFVRRETIVLPAGQSYLAKARR